MISDAEPSSQAYQLFVYSLENYIQVFHPFFKLGC